MGIPDDKPLNASNMISALEKLKAMPTDDEIEAIVNDSAKVADIRNYLNTKVLPTRNVMSTEDAKSFSHVSIFNKAVVSDDRQPREVVLQYLVYVMASVDRSRKDNMEIDTQLNSRTGSKLQSFTGHHFAWLEGIRKKAGIGFIAPTGISGNGDPVPEFIPKAERSSTQSESKKPSASDKRRQSSPASNRNSEKTMPKIQTPVADAVADPAQSQSQKADDRDPDSGTEELEGTPEIHIFEPLTLDSLLETPPLDFLTDNLIVRNTVNVFFAPAKTGKTYLCLNYALCLAMDLPFLGMENHRKRNIGYLNLDMFRGGFNDRVKQVIRGFNPNATPEQISNILARLKIIDRESIRSAGGRTPNFFENKYLDDLRFFIETNDIEFLFVDTFSRIRAGSKENDNDHMGLVLQNAEEFFTPLQCGSLFIHHTGKDQTTIRGAQALIDNSEFVFGLRKVNGSNKHLQLFSDTPRYTDVFELDIYPVFEHCTNEDTGASHAESYFLSTVDPDSNNTDIIDFLKSKGNPWMSKKSIGLGVGGNYGNRLKEVDDMYLKGKLERVSAGRGFNFRLKL